MPHATRISYVQARDYVELRNTPHKKKLQSPPTHKVARHTPGATRGFPRNTARSRGLQLLLQFLRLVRLEFVEGLQTRGTHMDGLARRTPELTL